MYYDLLQPFLDYYSTIKHRTILIGEKYETEYRCTNELKYYLFLFPLKITVETYISRVLFNTVHIYIFGESPFQAYTFLSVYA